MPGWCVYVLTSRRRATTYVGVTTDLERRLAQHNGERPGGAKSTRAGRPWRVARSWGPYPTRGRAQTVELRLKRLKGKRRLESADPGDA